MKEKLAVLAAVFVPGLGQIILGRPVNGLFVLASCCFFGLLAVFRLLVGEATFIGDDRWLLLALGAGGAAWAIGLIETIQIGFRGKSRRTQNERDQHIRNGMTSYLKGEFGRAEAELEQALKLDPTDGDARFHLAMVQKAQGRHADAKRTLKKCLALDENTKWYPEIAEELEQLSS
ncbi:MAG: tetratricopeptide repeat protein [Planctomycetes bacterium]|nr:tetratricopeptide repeat protein [Planctomycetota bacterium]